jgi:hypothetical protein
VFVSSADDVPADDFSDPPSLGLILGLVFGLALIAVAIVVLLVKFRFSQTSPHDKQSDSEESDHRFSTATTLGSTICDDIPFPPTINSSIDFYHPAMASLMPLLENSVDGESGGEHLQSGKTRR